MHIDTFISHLIMTNLKLPSPSSSSQDERTGDETTVSSISNNVGDDDDSWQSKNNGRRNHERIRVTISDLQLVGTIVVVTADTGNAACMNTIINGVTITYHNKVDHV
jgi:hypothetical protein